MRLAVLALAMLGSVAVAAEEPQPKPLEKWLTAGIEIDASGHVQSLQWDEDDKVESMLTKRLTPAVQAWEFEPGMLDGKPVPTQTGLAIHVRLEPLGDDSLSMRVLDARTGPTAAALSAPAYPMSAVMNGVSARVRVVVEVAADGSPIIRDMDYESDQDRHSGNITGGNKPSAMRKAFFASTTEAVKRWKFRPETVGGHVLDGATVRIPVEYCLDRSAWCERGRAKWHEGEKLPAGLHMGESSAVALKTDISASTI